MKPMPGLIMVKKLMMKQPNHCYPSQGDSTLDAAWYASEMPPSLRSYVTNYCKQYKTHDFASRKDTSSISLSEMQSFLKMLTVYWRRRKRQPKTLLKQEISWEQQKKSGHLISIKWSGRGMRKSSYSLSTLACLASTGILPHL